MCLFLKSHEMKKNTNGFGIQIHEPFRLEIMVLRYSLLYQKKRAHYTITMINNINNKPPCLSRLILFHFCKYLFKTKCICLCVQG